MRQLELRHIRCVVCVAKHLHFARAADELEIAAPQLTKHIQEAERLLGARLFHRTKRSVALTAAGEAYLAEVLPALDHLARGAERAALAERGELGRIEIGYVASAAYAGVLREAVGGFRAAHPRIEVMIREVPMERVPALLNDGQLDAAYVRPPLPSMEGIQTVTVYRDTFVLALPADSELAQMASLTPAQLRDQRFVLPEQEAGTYELARRGRFSPQLGPRPGTLAAVLACVSLGGNVAVVPHTLADCIALPGVVYRPISGKPIPSEIALAFRRFERAPAVRAFLDDARRRVASD
ncbi:DNA-binding transcriptional regulator, LysR family [Paraburkholderia phenazinium]|jgi:DNA-binding transcriptional LysR family regulator|uniref:DNA-binding transcriptional regulator, LysR family n=1 Tax=Paraburkholderia phenazinium TaxID=60549 RepID=A0A1G8ASB7_9BURK|nr:LysR family transcriptional regulator [Paraburkholderia phenazinium]SDH23865.1 DNA-binding transcriptional regulator, LysR family [Paraburkholderia phenazinium]